MKLYGSLQNRLEEGKNYNQDKLIHPGDDITMYHYTDCTCYFVTRVVDQKHIFVKPYQVCADHSKEGGEGHQDWMYFKSTKEMDEYLKQYFPDHIDSEREDPEEEWVFRYGSWRRAIHKGPQDLQVALEELREIYQEANASLSEEELEQRALNRLTLVGSDQERIKAGKEITNYYELGGKISFGILNYYYDWSF